MQGAAEARYASSVDAALGQAAAVGGVAACMEAGVSFAIHASLLGAPREDSADRNLISS